jgi:integrase
VLRLRPCDLDPHEGALRLDNEKQRSELTARKLVYVSPWLVGDLQRLAAASRIPPSGYLLRGRRRAQPVSRQYAWKLINAYALAAGVLVQTPTARSRPAHARDFRHGSAVNQIRQGVPLTEIQQQLGHASLSSTSIYTKLANPERRAMADRVRW